MRKNQFGLLAVLFILAIVLGTLGGALLAENGYKAKLGGVQKQVINPNLPDLVIRTMHAVPKIVMVDGKDNPGEGGVMAKIFNSGGKDAKRIVVKLKLDPLETFLPNINYQTYPHEPIEETQMINELKPGQYEFVFFYFPVKSLGLHTIQLSVDPENKILESDENNNKRNTQIWAKPTQRTIEGPTLDDLSIIKDQNLPDPSDLSVVVDPNKTVTLPDLVVSYYGVTTQNCPGDKLRHVINIKNEGLMKTQSHTSGKLFLERLTNENGDEINRPTIEEIYTMQIPIIDGGYLEAYFTECDPSSDAPKYGNYNAYVHPDWLGNVNEGPIGEANNFAMFNFTFTENGITEPIKTTYRETHELGIFENMLDPIFLPPIRPDAGYDPSEF